jgi:predicted acylesterase/phospholipase RssA
VLNDERTPYLFVCATKVKTNQRKIFRPGELGVSALTASACLPTIFRSVEVNGDLRPADRDSDAAASSALAAKGRLKCTSC